MSNSSANSKALQRRIVDFFHSIGLKPVKESEFDRSLRSYGGSSLLQELHNAGKQSDVDPLAVLRVLHSDLKITRLALGKDHARLCASAEMLASLPIPPNARILDIGGGAGQLAFWMAHYWSDCSITVVDPVCTNVGQQWADEIGQDRVRFVEGTMFDLNRLGEEKFDIITMAAVLSFIRPEGLPGRVLALSREQYLATPEAQSVLAVLQSHAGTLKSVLKPNGLVAVIECWADARLLLISPAFEAVGLMMNLNLSRLTHKSTEDTAEFSLLVFSGSLPAQS